jgi:hypothetical protein
MVFIFYSNYWGRQTKDVTIGWTCIPNGRNKKILLNMGGKRVETLSSRWDNITIMMDSYDPRFFIDVFQLHCSYSFVS